MDVEYFAEGGMMAKTAPVIIAASLPRFVRIYYQVATGTFTAGTISAYLALSTDQNNVGRYPAGFSVS